MIMVVMVVKLVPLVKVVVVIVVVMMVALRTKDGEDENDIDKGGSACRGDGGGDVVV